MPVPEKLNLADQSVVVEHNQKADRQEAAFRIEGRIDQPFISAPRPDTAWHNGCCLVGAQHPLYGPLWDGHQRFVMSPGNMGDRFPGWQSCLAGAPALPGRKHGKVPAVRIHRIWLG